MRNDVPAQPDYPTRLPQHLQMRELNRILRDLEDQLELRMLRAGLGLPDWRQRAAANTVAIREFYGFAREPRTPTEEQPWLQPGPYRLEGPAADRLWIIRWAVDDALWRGAPRVARLQTAGFATPAATL
jgi:hypothetical protein